MNAVRLTKTATGPLDRLRVDIVGSLLRPPPLRASAAAHRAGEITDADLIHIQDAAVVDVLRTQQDLGMPVLVDGEFRRSTFMDSFAEVAGFEELASNLWAAHVRRALDTGRSGRVEAPSAAGRTAATRPLRLTRNRPREDYEFARDHAEAPVKVTLIGPDRIFQMFDAAGSREVYPEPADFLRDVVRVQREMITGLVEAGCRYVHIDAPGLTAYIDPPTLERMRDAGQDPVRVLQRGIEAENAVIADFPGVTFGVHLCRGNEQGHWHREGSYDAIAEQLFGQLAHHRLLVEYDTERAGGFEPLRYVPDTTTVVLGLVTTKSGEIETVDLLRRRIEEAARYVPLDRLAISPQCGFASTIEGNPITEDDQ
ncbi:MAG: cobalamin-independent methionine synthase II family protein, partial [Pseudonocardia sp.]|nr:cobalamin-independent methionine synthase II family protein [Pseudonocardia sp.]